MIKALALLKRKPGTEVEAFQEHWRTRHAPIVAELSGIRRYVQSHTLLSGYRRGEPPYDGMAEVWFDDLAAMQANKGTAAERALREDEARFLDLDEMRLILVDDHVIKDGTLPGPAPDGYVKSVELITRKPGMAVADFQRYWREVHGPLGARITQVLRYVQSHPRPGGYAGGRSPAFDGAALTWFASTDAMRESARSEAYVRIRADEANFLRPGPSPVIIAREHVVIG